MRLRKMIILVGFSLMAIGLAACAGGGATAVVPATPSASSMEPEATTAASDRLVIYSGRSESLVQPIIDQFKAATGIDVQVRYGSTSEMAGVLLEEGANSPADLFYAQDPGGLGAVQGAGMLAALPAELVADVVPRFVADNREWVGISGRARVVVYNTSAITDPAAELPADIYDFVDEKWNGRIGWAPTNGSFQAMVTAMRVLWGEDKTRDWLTGIQANNPVVYDGNTPIVAGVAAGEVEVGFVNHYYLYRFLAEQGEGFAARNYFLPGGGPGSLIMVSGVGILRTAPNAANAARFIAYLLSLEGQQYFADQTYEYPVISGVNTVAGLPALADLDAAAVPITLTDLADLAGTQALLVELGIIE
ncbi:MAG: iron ABC transporter substrate-binding protein [Chloroflexi bacterium]|nr:iron ABC transporter substrate-binding protein [Chloroflexota bacterium]